MEQIARVVKISEYGNPGMSRAIAQGLVASDMRDDMEKTLRENEILRRENGILRAQNANLTAINVENRHTHSEAYKTRLREKERLYDMRYIAVIIVITTVMVTITVASVVLWGLGL